MIAETSLRSCNRFRVLVLDAASRYPDIGWVVAASFVAVFVGILISR